MFDRLMHEGFDFRPTYHADSILERAFSDLVGELVTVLLSLEVPIEEVIAGGGGEAQVTQRTRRRLTGLGWQKTEFNIRKTIRERGSSNRKRAEQPSPILDGLASSAMDERTTFAQTHEIDHVKRTQAGSIALEIEWNNKDTFFDRDLENFSRLHADGGISAGLIVTRGASLQDGIEARIRKYAEVHNVQSFENLSRFGVDPTPRQRKETEDAAARPGSSFAEAWASRFVKDKFASSTTHWSKLMDKLDRGVGSPCPIVAIGIPLLRIVDGT